MLDAGVRVSIDYLDVLESIVIRTIHNKFTREEKNRVDYLAEKLVYLDLSLTGPSDPVWRENLRSISRSTGFSWCSPWNVSEYSFATVS